jgi:hypothetical protein
MRTGSEKPDKEGQSADRDLEILLQGERDGEDGDGLVLGRQGADLQELVLRIRLTTK